MNSKYTHVTLLVDRSGSMDRIANDMMGGIKNYLKGLNPSTTNDKCLINMYEFDDRFDVVCENTQVQMVGDYKLVPRGWTQLLDAMGQTITRMGKYFDSLPAEEKPGKVIVLVVTDGKENRSTKFNKEQIRKMVDEQTNTYKWEFVFIGAGLNDFSDAASIGVAVNNMNRYDATPAGVEKLWGAVKTGSNAYRSMSQNEYAQHVTERKGFFQVSKQ